MSALALDDEQRTVRTPSPRRRRRPAPLAVKGTEGASTDRCSARWATTGCCAASSAAPPTSRARDAAAIRLCLLRETHRHRLRRGRDRARAAGPGQLPDPAVRLARDHRAVDPRRGGGHDRGRLCALRARRGLRRRGPVAASRPRRRRVAAVRREDRGSPTLPRPTSTRCSLAPPKARAPRGVTAFAVAGDADGLIGEHLDLVAPHAIGRLVFDGVRVDAATCSARSTPVSGGDAHPRPVPSQRRRLRRRDGAGRPRRHPGPRRDPDGSRRPADPAAVGRATRWRTWPPSSRPPDCWCAPPRAPTTAGRPAATITRTAAMAKLFATEAAQTIVDQACSCTARAASSAAICSSTSTATSARHGSTRAPPRCNARSSPVASSEPGCRPNKRPGNRGRP